ncbi:MAG: hypothetical protein WAW17_31175 [Rhodococcus sp. (in: high G+C Gram-positive bacteria)]
MSAEQQRLLVSPVGWPLRFRAATITPANKSPILGLNRYPRQVIGISLRLPSEETASGQIRFKALSILWAKPARWWK